LFLVRLRFERADNWGAYRIPSETGLLIPSVYKSYFLNLPAEPKSNGFGDVDLSLQL
jgi:hypothetical protein